MGQQDVPDGMYGESRTPQGGQDHLPGMHIQAQAFGFLPRQVFVLDRQFFAVGAAPGASLQHVGGNSQSPGPLQESVRVQIEGVGAGTAAAIALTHHLKVCGLALVADGLAQAAVVEFYTGGIVAPPGPQLFSLWLL